MLHNGERGEVILKLGDVEGVLCAEMGRLPALSTAINAISLQDIYEKIHGAEPNAMLAVIDCLLIDGDGDALKAEIKSMEDYQKISIVALLSLSSFVEDDGVKKALGELVGPLKKSPT